jgi:(R,R)-butanediol dehydrogenase/meso-butanediol dehydrogenase/diacetyl reductase
LRQDLARALGATIVRHPSELDVPSIAEPDRIVAGAVDVVFECSGKRAAMEAGLAQLRRAGRLVMVGAGIEAPTFDPNRILLNELVITGSFTYDAGGFDRALELLGSHAMPVDLLLEPGAIALDQLLDAMKRLAAGELAAKVLVAPGSDAPDKGGQDG